MFVKTQYVIEMTLESALFEPVRDTTASRMCTETSSATPKSRG